VGDVEGKVWDLLGQQHITGSQTTAMGNSDEIPRLPDGLLTHVKRSRFWVIENADLVDEQEVSDLISRLYDYPEDDFYFYKQHDHPTNRHHQTDVNKEIIVLTEWKLNFYPHPTSKRSYVEIDKDRITWDWQQDVILTSPMFIRFELKLTTKARRAFEQRQLIAAQKQADHNPIELKPNFMGFGVDLYKAFDWLRAKFKKQ
jgi:hypothetical protein